jgi:hypothetical protein
MDFEKILKFASEQLSEYSWAFWQTICAPRMLFQNTLSASQNTSSQFEIHPSLSSERLNPAVIVFFTINIVLGTSLNSLAPERHSGPELVVTFLVCFATSILYGALLHMICILLGGRGTSQSTLSACLQVTSTIFVVSCLAGLFASLMFYESHLRKYLFFSPIFRNGIWGSFSVTLLVQFIMQSVYMPAVMTRVHTLNRRKTWMLRGVMIIAATLGTAICILLYAKLGIMAPMQG